MKTIIYLIAAVLISVTLSSAVQKSGETTRNILLKSTDKNTSSADLTRCTEIIAGRLKIYGVKSFDVRVLDGKRQIRVRVTGNTDMPELETLLTTRGELAFYETENHNGITGILKDSNPLLTGSDVETVTSSADKNSQSCMIEIKFKPASAGLWAEATRRNLNKPIALAIDGRVLYTPVVKDPQDKGLCEISGTMTLLEVNYFLALVNNEKLPLSLIVE